MSWLSSTDPVYLRGVAKLVISLQPVSFFDIMTICDALRNGHTEEMAAVLTDSIVKAGIDVACVEFAAPDLKHLEREAKLFGFKLPDIEQIREEWVQHVDDALKLSEYDVLCPQVQRLLTT